MRRATGAFGRGARALALAVAGSAASFPASAVFNDWFEVWAAENVTHDTNVFRLSSRLDPVIAGAPRGLADTIYSTYLGAVANVPVAQQRFEASYTWHRAQYDTYDHLDYDGYSLRAAWLYNLQNKVTGVLSYDEAQTLASFATFQVPLKDLVTVRAFRGSAEWAVTPRYRATGRLGLVQTEHDQPLRKVNDIESASTELGLSYVTPQDNLIGGAVRFERGRSPHDNVTPDTPFFGQAFNNEYDQWGAGVTATWNLTGHSRFDGRLEYIRRHYDVFTNRNYEGPAFRALYRWTPTPKITVDVAALRDVGPPEEVQTSFVLITGGYIRPKWQITEKIYVQGNAEYNVWDYRGDPITGGSFTHHQRLVGASIQWKPWERIWLNAGINREVRTSTLAFGDYETTVSFIEGRIGF